MFTRCKANTKSGEQCPNGVMKGYDHCFVHEPAMKERRRESSKTGGHNKSTERRTYKRLPSDLRGALDTLYRTLAGLEAGDVEPAKATAIATVSRAIVTVYEAGLIETKVRELEERLNLQSENE